MMRFFLLPLILASCSVPGTGPQTSAQPESKIKFQSENRPILDAASPAKKPDQIPQGPIQSPAFIRTSLSGISIDAVTFDSRSHFLAVADQAGGPGSQWPDSRAAARAIGGVAAINAGFFTPEGTPLGKVIASGNSSGAINRSSSLGSGFYVQNGGSMGLVRRENFRGGDQALQSGPFLVENGRSSDGLSKKQSSARSFVAYDGASRWVIARTGACSLSSLAQAIEGKSLGGVALKTALNLDGGRSSEMWISGDVRNGPHFERPFWNKPVRNFIILSSRR